MNTSTFCFNKEMYVFIFPVEYGQQLSNILLAGESFFVSSSVTTLLPTLALLHDVFVNMIPHRHNRRFEPLR